MNQIFISYRRDDGADTAQLLQMHFIKMFGEDAVFLDTNTMKPGEEFPVALNNAVVNASIVVVMIGKNWKGSDPNINRLEQEGDWVRKELEIALADKKKKIFPLLVKGETPAKAFLNLPKSIDSLARFNCVELREKEFKVDLLPLIPLIEPHLTLEDPLKNLPLDEDRYTYPPGSPYKGLEYFTEKDAKLFFGRGAEIRKIYNKIKNGNILFLYGQSGSGKSSLLFAGLKPRMEKQGWKLEYFRRESGINLAEKLNAYLSNLQENSKQLVIIDQVEEIFTNPDENISAEIEAHQILSIVKKAGKKIRVLLSFRKEYLAEIKKLFTGLTLEEIYLEPLQTKGVLEAIRGITNSDEACDNYELEFNDAEVPLAIAQSVLSDEESHVGPLLQVILRKMWDKVENKKPRIFSKELLEEVKSKSLISFLYDQIFSVRERFKVEVLSGLVLDALYFFTTPRGTSALNSKESVKNNYSYPNILHLITELKNKYLLTELKGEDADAEVIRLAHDSLAPLIRELYAQSNLPGQRASRLLESKSGDIKADFEVEFSKPDIGILDAGKNGMRKWTDKENEVIEKSRIRIRQYSLELEEKNKQLELVLKEAKEQSLQVKAKTLAAISRNILLTDPTIALRVAEAACKVTAKASEEAQAAFVDILEQDVVFYKKNIFGHTDRVLSVAFSPNGEWILTGSRD
jgi:energy-coupling factor transporter ATP-binding protein EcfA2